MCLRSPKPADEAPAPPDLADENKEGEEEKNENGEGEEPATPEQVSCETKSW